MTAWCGDFSGQGTWLHWTVNPCILESVSSVLLVCTAALVLSFQCRKIVLLRQKKYPGSKRIPSAAVAFYVCILCVVAAHAALLIASIVVYIRGTARYPYELFNQSASLLLWLGALVSRLASSSRLFGSHCLDSCQAPMWLYDDSWWRHSDELSGLLCHTIIVPLSLHAFDEAPLPLVHESTHDS